MDIGRLTDLRDEGSEAPRVFVQEDASDVTNNFVCATDDHAPHPPPSFPFKALNQVHYRSQRKHEYEDQVRRKGWSIAIHTLFDGTELQRLVMARALREGIWRTSKVQLALGPNVTRYCWSDILRGMGRWKGNNRKKKEETSERHELTEVLVWDMLSKTEIEAP